MNQAPSTPQRVFVQTATGINQMRPSLQNQSPNVYANVNFILYFFFDYSNFYKTFILNNPQTNSELIRHHQLLNQINSR